MPKSEIFRWNRPHAVLSVYGMLLSIGAFLAALSIVRIPADPKSIALIGLSWSRLALTSLTLISAFLLAGLSVWAHRNRKRAARLWSKIFNNTVLRGSLRWGALAIFLLAGITALVPHYRYGVYQYYFIRLVPFILWLSFFGAATAFVAFVETSGLHWLKAKQAIPSPRMMARMTALLLATFLLIWILIATTGLGLPSAEFEGSWYEAGVPVLVGQVMIALGAGIVMFYFEHGKLERNWKKLDQIFFFSIWIITAILWAREPINRSFFAPGPYPPNFEYYPYSDAATFDMGSQYALIGQGLNNGVSIDHSLYMGFLLFLHTLSGQQYDQVMAWQAAIYAVFPAILYMLATAIRGRPVGAILAVLVALRGVNGIAASTFLSSTNQKQMLTDFPTAIGLALVALLIVFWLKKPTKVQYVIWAGGVVGLLNLVRLNSLFIWPFVLILVLVVCRQRWLKSVGISTLMTIAMAASALPSGIQQGGLSLDLYLQKIRTVIRERWNYEPPETPAMAISPIFPPYAPTLVKQIDTIQLIKAGTVNFSDTSEATSLQGGEEGFTLFPDYVATRFLHNIVTSVLILPTSPFLHDLRSTISEINAYWQPGWNGPLDASESIGLGFNLLLIAIGISLATQRVGLAGFAPLGIFLSYDLANAFARTSGGRYVVPIDWIVLLYFILGLWQATEWILSPFESQNRLEINNSGPPSHLGDVQWSLLSNRIATVPILFFLSIGAILSLSGNLFPQRYTAQSNKEILSQIDQLDFTQQTGLSLSDVHIFLQQPDAVVLNGRALYPRFYFAGRGESLSFYPYLAREFPRLAFTMIGAEGRSGVILPIGRVSYFPNAADAIVFGCKEDHYIDALVVVVQADEAAVYVRQPPTSLQCPLQQPVVVLAETVVELP